MRRCYETLRGLGKGARGHAPPASDLLRPDVSPPGMRTSQLILAVWAISELREAQTSSLCANPKRAAWATVPEISHSMKQF